MNTSLLSSRVETRRSRYEQKKKIATQYPIELAALNFEHSENVGMLIRSAACFGVPVVNIIGTIPDHRTIVATSGSTQDLVKINQFANPYEFLSYSRQNNIKLISAEFCEGSQSLWDYKFPTNNEQRCCIITGHETIGVPVDILVNSDVVFIKMPGSAYCLNTAVCASILLAEYVRQRENKCQQQL